MDWRQKILRTFSGAAKEQHRHIKVITATHVKARQHRRKVKAFQQSQQTREERRTESERRKAALKNAKVAARYNKNNFYSDDISDVGVK